MEKELVLLTTVVFESEVKVKSFGESGLEFSDGTKIEDFHSQDCCEHVYADWKQLQDQGIENESFTELRIYGKKQHGIVLKPGEYGTSSFMVPCYNEQNGYYGSDLELQIKMSSGAYVKVDVSEHVKDDID